MIGGVKTQYPAENKHGRLILVLYYSSLSTLTRSILILHNFVANLALPRLRAFWGALLAEIWWRGVKNILVDRASQFITILHKGRGVYQDPEFVFHNKWTAPYY